MHIINNAFPHIFQTSEFNKSIKIARLVTEAARIESEKLAAQEKELADKAKDEKHALACKLYWYYADCFSTSDGKKNNCKNFDPYHQSASLENDYSLKADLKKVIAGLRLRREAFSFARASSHDLYASVHKLTINEIKDLLEIFKNRENDFTNLHKEQAIEYGQKAEKAFVSYNEKLQAKVKYISEASPSEISVLLNEITKLAGKVSDIASSLQENSFYYKTSVSVNGTTDYIVDAFVRRRRNENFYKEAARFALHEAFMNLNQKPEEISEYVNFALESSLLVKAKTGDKFSLKFSNLIIDRDGKFLKIPSVLLPHYTRFIEDFICLNDVCEEAYETILSFIDSNDTRSLKELKEIAVNLT